MLCVRMHEAVRVGGTIHVDCEATAAGVESVLAVMGSLCNDPDNLRASLHLWSRKEAPQFTTRALHFEFEGIHACVSHVCKATADPDSDNTLAIPAQDGVRGMPWS